MTEPVLDWLLAGDPSIRWQTLDALTSAGPEQVAAERAAVAREGWGARLLGEQDDDGRWAGALYSPKWVSTTYTLLLLERLGLPSDDPRARRGCSVVWDAASWWDGGLTLALSIRAPEVCITGMLVQLAARFGPWDHRVDDAVRFLLTHQLGDGGWNCQSIRRGSRHGSFHTSIIVLEALTAYATAGGTVPVEDPLTRGREFFLAHSLYRSHRTGEVVDRSFTRFPFPPQWHFDVLRGLEHFASVGAATDPRLEGAVAVVRAARRADGRWPVHRGYSGREWFRMEQPGPSRWTTLRALRVLRWWDGSDAR
ncbi:hypothetical protein [Cellulomonas sp.]|uniref:hypothetical protein n=1 Tax=Cellulomonas sp. TaxID=40001 RepID=UPI003BAAAC55